MAIRKKKKSLRKKPGRRKTGIPKKKYAFSIALRKYIPFIVIAAVSALIILFLWAQSRVTEPRKLKIKDLVQAECGLEELAPLTNYQVS